MAGTRRRHYKMRRLQRAGATVSKDGARLHSDMNGAGITRSCTPQSERMTVCSRQSPLASVKIPISGTTDSMESHLCGHVYTHALGHL